MPSISREDGLAELEDGHRRVAELVATLSDDELERPATIGGGDWSAKDLLGHLDAWERVALDRLRAARAGRPVPPFPRGGVDRFNAERAAETMRRSLDRVRSDADRTHRALVAELRATTEEQWRTPVQVTETWRARLGTLLGRTLGAPKRPYGHAFAHIPDLEAYVRSLRDSRRAR